MVAFTSSRFTSIAPNWDYICYSLFVPIKQLVPISACESTIIYVILELVNWKKQINTLMFFWLILGQRRTSLVVFL